MSITAVKGERALLGLKLATLELAGPGGVLAAGDRGVLQLVETTPLLIPQVAGRAGMVLIISNPNTPCLILIRSGAGGQIIIAIPMAPGQHETYFLSANTSNTTLADIEIEIDNNAAQSLGTMADVSFLKTSLIYGSIK